MKKFISKIFLFIVLLLGVEGYISKLIKEGKFTINIINSGIFQLQIKSKQHKQTKRLIIGDSVCDQLYPGSISDDSVCSLASNQGTTIAGYYMLVNNFLKINNPQEVWLIISPQTLQNDLSNVSYNYFLKPFFTNEYKQLFNDNLIDKIKEVPYYWLCQFPAIFSTSYTPEFETSKAFPISSTSESYIDSLQILCKKKNIKFYLRITPVSQIYRDEVNEMKLELNKEPYISAFSRIEFFDDDYFIDHVHFKRNYIPKDYLNFYE